MPPEARTGSHVERMLALKRVPALGTLPAGELAVVAEFARERFFAKGSTLLREGEPLRALYVILDGEVHVRRKGRDLGHAPAGSGLGLYGLLAGDEDGIEAVAESDTYTLEFDADAALEIFEDRFPILRHMMRQLCADLVAMMRRLEPVGKPPWERPILTPQRDLDFVDRIVFLRQAAPFARASINALAELSRGMTEVHFDPGVTLWKEGDPARGLLLVVSGTVTCTCSTLEKPFQLGPGTPLGSIEVLAGLPRWYDVVTETRLVGLSGDVEGLIDVFEDNFEMAMDYMAVISRLLLTLLERMAERGQSPLGSFYGCENAESSTP